MKNVLLISTIVFFNHTVFANEYDSAVDAAQRAFLIQSGIQQKINLVQDYATKESLYLVQKTGLEKEVATILFSYKVYREKSVSFPIDSKKRLTIGVEQITLRMDF